MRLPLKALVNGRATKEISLTDRGLLYGDGLFETIAVKDGQAKYLNLHLKRLRLGCKDLGISAPEQDLLRKEISQVCHDLGQAVLKIVVTRGPGGRGYRPDSSAQTTRIVTIHPWPAYPARYRDEGIIATVCNARLSRNHLLAGIKHLNRLEHVMGRREWQDEYQEGLMMDDKSQVIEGTMSNLFLIRDDVLVTPELDEAGVAGIMREQILSSAQRLGISTEIHSLGLPDVLKAEGLFFTNSLIGMWPVRRLGEVLYDRHPYIDTFMENLFFED
ncbi:MAG: aminodeoxychorismate lyase [Gammaproteobacteria bacterium]|nr:aminodeoxychorismate lyase [Gammaproteobacteria bacterium]